MLPRLVGDSRRHGVLGRVEGALGLVGLPQLSFRLRVRDRSNPGHEVSLSRRRAREAPGASGPIERKSGEHEDESCQSRNRAGKRDEGDDGERERQEEDRRRRVTGRAKRRGRGIPAPEHEQAGRGERDEDERRAHEEGDDLRERARQDVGARERGEERRRAARRPRPRVERGERRRKEAVAAHGQVDARRHQQQRECARDDRQRNDGGENGRTRRPEQRLAGASGERLRIASLLRRHEIQERERRRDVENGDRRGAECERARQLAPRIPHFPRDAARLPEPAEGVERADETEPERLAHRKGPGAPREERRQMREASRTDGRGADHDREERRHLARRQPVEDARAQSQPGHGDGARASRPSRAPASARARPRPGTARRDTARARARARRRRPDP